MSTRAITFSQPATHSRIIERERVADEALALPEEWGWHIGEGTDISILEWWRRIAFILLHRLAGCPSSNLPMGQGQADVREIAEELCENENFYLFLMPKNAVYGHGRHKRQYLCYPKSKDPVQQELNARHRAFFREVEAKRAATLKDAQARVEAVNNRLELLTG